MPPKRKVKIEDSSGSSDIEVDESRSSSKKATAKDIKKPRASVSKRAKKEEDEEDEAAFTDEEDADVKPKLKAKAKTASKASTSKRPKVKDEDDDLLAEEPPEKKPKISHDGLKRDEFDNSKFEIPEGQPNCLAGITFVFTGELKSLDREGAQQLAKRYGGRVTGAPSSKTTYIVIGEGAGASKLKKLETLKGPQKMSEEEFFSLILTRSPGEVDEKTLKKAKDDEKKMKEDAKRMGPQTKDDKALTLGQLWTVKYAPKSMKDVCGNKGILEKMQKWLESWPKSLKSNFKKPGPDGLNTYRAILVSGPPGIGKTTSAHLVARLAGYVVIELNASDTRSKKLLELGFRSAIDNTSLDGFFGSGSKKQFPGQPDAGDKAVLIMDEVDGMSGGDRGGVGALNMLIKKTKIPIICIANDSKSQKMRPLQNTTYGLTFKRPDVNMIRSRMMSIAYKEGISISAPVIEQLITGAQSDIRSVINMMSTYALSAKGAMDFDTGKELVLSSAKNHLQNPFTLMDKLFSPYMFSASSKTTLSEKLEIYFHDFSIMPLFVQENYLKHSFSRAQGLQGRDADLKRIDLVARAAESISDGDILDSLIHSSQQQWTLLPAHGMASTVRPAYYCFGQGSFGKGPGGFSSAASSRSFPGWLGKNSTTNRLKNALGDVQIRMRLNVSGDRSEIRQTYLPVLMKQLSAPLAAQGQDGIEEVIALMDDYYLTKDEFDTVMELGLGDEFSGETLLKGVNAATKSALTRTFNKGKHPIPFHKASDIAGKAAKKMPKSEQPDNEDVLELDEAVEEVEEEEVEDDQAELAKDKLLKAKKPKATKATKKATGETAAKGKVKAKSK